MFAYKKNYYLIIENIKDIELSNIKERDKFIIILRNIKFKENNNELFRFRKICKSKGIKFFVANNIRLAVNLKADGFYISANNTSFKRPYMIDGNLEIVGAAHNYKELNLKQKQNCSKFIFSRLFQTTYIYKKSFLGVLKFNKYSLLINKNLIPLGGIRLDNLNRMRDVKSDALVIFSEIKKKPAIANRLF